MLETSFSSYKQTTRWNSDIYNFFGEKFNFGLYFIRKLGKIGNYDVIVTSYTGYLYFLVYME